MDAAQRVAVILSETKYLVHSDFETLHHVQDDTLPDESVSGRKRPSFLGGAPCVLR